MLLCLNSSLVVTMLCFHSQNTCKVASKTWGVICPHLWKTPAINDSVSFHPTLAWLQAATAVSHLWLMKWHPLADHMFEDQVPKWESQADNAKIRHSAYRCCPLLRDGLVAAAYYMAAHFSSGLNSSFENTAYVNVQEMKNKRRKLSNDAFQAENVTHICLNEHEHYLF